MRILKPWRQEHLLRYWSQLGNGEKDRLAAQIEAIDKEGGFKLVDGLYQEYTQQKTAPQNAHKLGNRPESPDAYRMGQSTPKLTPGQAANTGRKVISEGKVGAIIVAGGQGTRLGFPHPKGMYPIGPASGRSLFQIHVDKIVARANRHRRSDGEPAQIPLYVMTSPTTDAATRHFFAAHDCFGLAEKDVTIFCQGTIPVVDEKTGKILLERRDQIATSPDGHGGLAMALHKAELFDQMKSVGIEHLFYLQVDNPLVDVCSPEYLGYHVRSKSEFSSQVIAKRQPGEKVGNVVRVGERSEVIEYSDLPDDLAQLRQSDGSLAIWAGSIAVHVIDRAFLKRMADRASRKREVLPFHFAHKKVTHVGSDGKMIQPGDPNAIKFERFIFDLMPHTDRATLVEVDREKAFAPLKNAPGEEEDTPEAVKAQMAALDADELAEKLNA